MSCYGLSAPLKLAAAISDKLLPGVRPVPLGGTRPPALLTRLPASGCLHSEGRRHEDVGRVYTPRYKTQNIYLIAGRAPHIRALCQGGPLWQQQ